MKGFIVISKEYLDCSTIIKILGIYSSEENAINRIYEFEVNELDDIFGDEPFNVHNHNNGFLEASRVVGFHEVWINTQEIEIDSNDSIISVLEI